MDRETRICLVGKAVLPRGLLLLKPQNHGSPEPVANIPQQLLQKTSPRVQAVKTGDVPKRGCESLVWEWSPSEPALFDFFHVV